MELKGNPSRGLISATLGFFIGFAAVALYGPTAKEFKDVMGLSGAMLGFLIAIPQLTGSLLRIPFGAWVDKVGGKKPFLVIFVLSIIGMLGLSIILNLFYPHGLTKSMYPIILILGALSGCGVATFSVGIPQTAYWFPKSKQGSALGIYGGLGNTAPGFFTLVLPFALQGLGLPGSYLAWLGLLMAGAVVYAIISQDAYYFQLIKKNLPKEKAIEEAKKLGQELFPSGTVKDALIVSAKIGRTWSLVMLYFVSFGGFLALTTWFPTYWREMYGFNARTAGILGGAGFSLPASFIRIYGGRLSDKAGGERTAIASFAIILLGAFILMFANSFPVSLAGELLISAGMGVANAAVFKLVPKYVPEAVGGASGWVGGIGAFGGFAVPPILGVFVDKFGTAGYGRGFVVYVILSVVCIIISYLLKKQFGEKIK